jgi:uncharacterized protein YjbI with pentapeptide repeats
MKLSLNPAADVTMTPLSRKQVEARIAAKQPLDGVMLRDMDLSHCDLSNINCTRSVFIKVCFRGVRFEGAKFSQSLFQECPMVGIRAAGVTLHQSPLVNCELAGATFAGGNLTEGAFIGCSLAQVDFSGCKARC